MHGFGLQGREAVKEILDPELVVAQEPSGLDGADHGSLGGTDHQSFQPGRGAGVRVQQDMDEYRLTHHTQSDTFDKAKEPNLVQGAQVMAVTAMRMANLPDLLPRDRLKRPAAVAGAARNRKRKSRRKAKRRRNPWQFNPGS